MAYCYKLVLGGIGDDAHSIGIGLLALGFKEAGFHVNNLGIRNDVRDFFQYTDEYDIMLLSNKNGHSELYLSEFSSLLAASKLTNQDPKVWYLGGSLSVNESDFVVKKKYLNMGFTNVYPRPVGFDQVLEDIQRDIHCYHIPKRHVIGESEEKKGVPQFNQAAVIDRKWTRNELMNHRKEVLAEFTGKPIFAPDTNKSEFYISLDKVLWQNKLANKTPLFQPRTGVADLEKQIDILHYLEEQGSNISSIQLDAASRSKMFDKAALGTEMSKEKKQSVLNGFPLPVYRTDEVRRLISSLKTPFQVRGGGPDHRLVYELALAAGISALEGGFLCYLFPYDKLTTPVESLRNWQFIDRLCANYEEEQNVTINREYFGVLTATLLEPSIVIVINIIQSILSAQQGIKSITIGYAEQGNRSQDIAAVGVMREMVNYYLDRFNYSCRITTVFHQYMAAFPIDYGKAEDLIFHSSITATLAGATKVMVKTPVEAIEIPNKYENGKALQICKKGALLASSVLPDYKQIAMEESIIKKTVSTIMEAIIELGNNSILKGALKAIECGFIDIPWSPNIYNHNKVKGIRDIDGAVRFLDFGNLPLDNEVREFHLEKVYTRKMMERDNRIFSLLEKDLTRISYGDFSAWPLDRTYVR